MSSDDQPLSDGYREGVPHHLPGGGGLPGDVELSGDEMSSPASCTEQAGYKINHYSYFS